MIKTIKLKNRNIELTGDEAIECFAQLSHMLGMKSREGVINLSRNMEDDPDEQPASKQDVIKTDC